MISKARQHDNVHCRNSSAARIAVHNHGAYVAFDKYLDLRQNFRGHANNSHTGRPPDTNEVSVTTLS